MKKLTLTEERDRWDRATEASEWFAERCDDVGISVTEMTNVAGHAVYALFRITEVRTVVQAKNIAQEVLDRIHREKTLTSSDKQSQHNL